MLRYLMAGESHGKALTAILEGVPSNLEIVEEDINVELRRRQMGYGRGGRMKIEKDKVEILSGVRWGKSLGTPISLIIRNKDWENWTEKMSTEQIDKNMDDIIITKPRPGHADLTGFIKYNQYDVRNILEFASARNSAIRVAVGAVCRKFLSNFGIDIFSFITEIGEIKADYESMDYDTIRENLDEECLKTPDKVAETKMVEYIKNAKENGDTVGGVFQIVVQNLPVGLGSYVQSDRRTDTKLAAAVMSIQAIKGVEFGLGFECARKKGSAVHDEIFYEDGFMRKTNNAGGIEGGMTNGEPIVINAAMKPIPTLYKPLKSVDINSKDEFEASVERSDASAVPAASVIGENVVAIEIADLILEKFGGDSMEEIKQNYDNYLKYVKKV